MRFCSLIIVLLVCVPEAAAQEGPRVDTKALRTIDAVTCSGNERIELKNVRIVVEGDGVRASGACSLAIVDSVVEATGRALVAEDNSKITLSHVRIAAPTWLHASGKASVKSRNSATKGAMEIQDEARFFDQGGNAQAHSAKGATGTLSAAAARRCVGNQTLTIENEAIKVERKALLVQGACKVVLKNVRIEADDEAIVIQGNPEVWIFGSTITAKKRAFVIVGSPRIRLSDTQIEGQIQKIGKAQITVESGEN